MMRRLLLLSPCVLAAALTASAAVRPPLAVREARDQGAPGPLATWLRDYPQTGLGVHPRMWAAPAPLAMAPAADALLADVDATIDAAGAELLARFGAPGAHHTLGYPLCANHRVPGVMGWGEHSVFTGSISDGVAGSEALSVTLDGPALQAFDGVNAWTGSTTVARGGLRVRAPASTALAVHSLGVLCVTGTWAPAAPVALSWVVDAGRAGVLHAESADVSAGCTISVDARPGVMPAVLFDADNLVGTCAAGTLPAGTQLALRGSTYLLESAE
jgi:hypothetical protein